MLEEPALTQLSAFALLGLGLVFGLKHATEADHIVAVSTIVSEQRSLLRSCAVGALWGIGHTISLVLVGILVLALRVNVPQGIAHWLEFGVALMIIGLGLSALLRLRSGRRRRRDVHLHKHNHDDGVSHVHLHFHEHETGHTGGGAVAAHSHAVSRIGFKPLLVGAMHGLAGSAALTLLVLTQIQSTALGLVYLAVFGIGSIAGMLLMSGLIGLPFALSARRLGGVNYSLQAIAGALSVAFGLWYAYQTGIASGLWQKIL
jgi:high-affinity nickel-transport protein